MRVLDIVEGILKQSRESRNSDKELFIRFMENFGIHLDPTQKSIFKSMPHLESVRRIRQKLQEQGKYQADQKIGANRRFKGYSMQQRAPKVKAQDIEKIIEASHAVSWLED